MNENYLNVLEESLQKKLQVMAKIQDYNLRQQEIFRSENVELGKFDEYVAEKGALIDEVTASDIISVANKYFNNIYVQSDVK